MGLPQIFGVLFSLGVFVSSLSCLVSLLLVVRKRSSSNSRNHRLPPQPAGSWPILGHLLLLGRAKTENHKTLGKMADENGPIFMLKLGLKRALVVSNREIAKECMSTHDIAFSNRPSTLAFKIFGSAMLMVSPYGPYWREMRKITLNELLSNRRLSLLKETIISELSVSIKELYNQLDVDNKAPNIEVNLYDWFADLTLNNILNLIIGKSLREFSDVNEKHRCQQAFRAMLRLMGEFTISDSLPFLKWFDIGGQEKAMKEVAAELDAISQGWLDDHKRVRASGKTEQPDFMNMLLGIFHNSHGNFFDYDVDTMIKATCQEMVLAGADTTLWTLNWSMTLMLNHPHVLNKAKQELNTHVGKEGTLDNSNLRHLTYLQAIIKETMRLYPVGGIIPRASSKDVVINGYYVPAGTQLFINVHKIHRDPLIYPNPNQFFPERFLDLSNHEYMDIRGQEYEYLPFGGGRRVCPGASYALQALLLTLATLLHNFDITLPSKEPIDNMSHRYEIKHMKANPLVVILSPRLPQNM